MNYFLLAVLTIGIALAASSTAVDFRLHNNCTSVLYAKLKDFTHSGRVTVNRISKDAHRPTKLSLEPQFYGVLYADVHEDAAGPTTQTQVAITLGPFYSYYVSNQNGYNLQVTVSPTPVDGDDTYYCSDVAFEIPSSAPSVCGTPSNACSEFMDTQRDHIYVSGNGANATYSCQAGAYFDVTFSCPKTISN